ncbi:MAG: hypothetical protein Q8S13_02620, partial [Dehalococcoidia bacterium]|nr:hypothetical protein [Dehalococcoidia bacterium]
WFTGYKSFENNTGTVDATSVVTESDETNNTNSKLLPVPTPPPSCTPTPTPPPVGGIAEFAEGQSSGGANTLVALIAALALAGGALALVALLRSR